MDFGDRISPFKNNALDVSALEAFVDWQVGQLDRLREALASSLNVPAVKALRYAGLQNVYNMAKKLGITIVSHAPDWSVVAFNERSNRHSN